jgi:hypothetical protein
MGAVMRRGDLAQILAITFAACGGGEARITAVATPPPPPIVDAAPPDRILIPPPPLPPSPDGAVEAFPTVAGTVVYAHSGSDLFSVDPETLQITRVGPLFEMVGGTTRYLNDVTDIAVDRQGRIVAVTYGRLLEVARTGACTLIAPLPAGSRFNGLSWIRSDAGEELLIATGLDGAVYRIDATTGAATRLGVLGAGLMSSGDLVSVASYGTLVTLVGPGGDRLARLDPTTGAATVIGPTGFSKIWGLGFWKDRVFGFTNAGEFILIDPRTGAGTLVDRVAAFPFWGAGVTTSAPVIE